MKIEQLTIENFKCFKREQTFDFGRLTVLTGANNSGKSSVIYAVLMALQSEGFPNSLSTNGDYVNLGDFKNISNCYDTNNLIQLCFKITSNSRLHYFKTIWKEDEVNFLPTIHQLEKKISPIENDTEKNHALLPFYKFGKKNINFIGAFRQAPRRTYLEHNKANFRIGTEGEEYIDQIVDWDKRSNRKIKQLIETMKELDLIDDIKIKRFGGGRFEVLVKPINSGRLTPLSDVGSSVSAFMPILVADLQLPNDSTLFLAAPETLLHPSTQSNFGDYIVKNINETEKNYVIETHSEYFLNKIRLAIVKGDLKKEDVKIYYLENQKEGTEVFDVDFMKTGGIRNAPDNFFRTYSNDIMDIAMNSFSD